MTPAEQLDIIHGHPIPAGFDLESECTGAFYPATRGLPTCVHALATGWTGLAQLCPACMRTVREALEAVVPGLTWHERLRGES